MKSEPLTLSVRADLFRIAARFLPGPENAAAHPELDGVRIEPCRAGGALLIAGDATGLIVLRDAKGQCSRPVTLRVPGAMLALAKDMLKGRAHTGDDGVDVGAVRLKARMTAFRGLRVTLEPRSGLESDVAESTLPYPDWRALMPTGDGVREQVALKADDAGRLALTAQSLAQATGADFDMARRSPFDVFQFSESSFAVVRFRFWVDGYALILPAFPTEMHTFTVPAWSLPIAAGVKATEAA